MPYTLQRSSARNLVLSPNKQLAVNGLLADAKLTYRQRFNADATHELTQTRRSDKEMAGKGSEFATNGQLTGWDSKVDFKIDLEPRIAGMLLAFVMGKDTVTGVADPYTHSFGFDQSTDNAPLTNIYVEDTNDVKLKLQDMALASLSFAFPAHGPIEATTAWMGTGQRTPGAMAALPALATAEYLLGNDMQFSMGPVGTPVSMVGRFMSGTLKIENGATAHKAPGGGLFGLNMRRGAYKFSLDAVIAASDTDDIFTILENDTAQGITLATNPTLAHQLKFGFPAAHLKASKVGVSGSMVIWNISLDDTTCYDVAGAGGMTASVLNAEATYLVGA